MTKCFIVDFHIHSKYSRATSKLCDPEHLDLWAKIKGINVVGTGDCVHPAWLNELKEKLISQEDNGLFRLKQKYSLLSDDLCSLPYNYNSRSVNFMLSTEISSIYKKGDKVRKVHNLCIFPDFESVNKFQVRLEKIGNIRSDGRPILGLDSKHLLEIVLEISPEAYLIPAHIWTPWFSVLGSKSGFDSLEECFEELTPYIFALETGLSSDPPMNRICSFLDKFRLVSNSDAHSPDKLGREANIFDGEISYKGIYNSLKNDSGFLGTIEFFPDEGKYHYDGHRKCHVNWDPLQTLEHNGICPVCNKPVTLGVTYRVAELADRVKDAAFNSNQFFHSITPLPELLAEIAGVKSTKSKKVLQEFQRLVSSLGSSEFDILLFKKIEEIRIVGGNVLAEAIDRLRKGEVSVTPGFDGEFGKVRVFKDGEIKSLTNKSLFPMGNLKANDPYKSINFDLQKFKALCSSVNIGATEVQNPNRKVSGNIEQKKAIEHFQGPMMVIAGPGTGKTWVLVKRIQHLVEKNNISASNILAVTFSNKAAEEIRERLPQLANEAKISTFHALGLEILRKHYSLFGRQEGFTLIDDEQKLALFEDTCAKKILIQAFKSISFFKQGMIIELSEEISPIYEQYEQKLLQQNMFDLDDLIYLPTLIKDSEELQYKWILVDEFQDINATQYKFIKLLLDEDNNIFVIGDPDQAIYGFRGSDVRFIKQIENDFSRIKIINLINSYRCPAIILQAAGQILNKQSKLKGELQELTINIQETATDASEADWIASKIEEMIGGVRTFSLDSGISDGITYQDITGFNDFAILCRTREMFSVFKKAMHNHGIAYQEIGTVPYYNQSPFKELIQKFKQAYRVEDNSIFREKILAKESLLNILSINFVAYDQELVSRFKRLLDKYDTDYEGFLDALSLRQGVDYFDSRAEAVSLMTMHASKGLEFQTVFIPGCETEMIPFELFGKKNDVELQEEERLFYVAMTRSKKYLYLTHASKRFFKGRSLISTPSYLLKRIQEDFAKFYKREQKKQSNYNQLSFFK